MNKQSIGYGALIVGLTLMLFHLFSFNSFKSNELKKEQSNIQSFYVNKDSLYKQYKKEYKSKELTSLKDNEVMNKVASIIDCVDQATCQLDPEDERKNAQLLRKELSSSLLRLKEEVKSNFAYESFAQIAARYFLQIPDYTIQMSALMLMESLPKNAENRDAILSGVNYTLSSTLLSKALSLLENYNSNRDVNKISSFIIENIKNGTFVAAPVAADKARKFMRIENVEDFETALKSLDTTSMAHRNLKLSVRDFRLTEGR